MSDHFTLQSSSGCSAATRGYPYKLLVNHCRINVRKHFLANVWNSQALLVLSHYCRLEILWVMSTSVYIPNTDRCFLIVFITDVFSF